MRLDRVLTACIAVMVTAGAAVVLAVASAPERWKDHVVWASGRAYFIAIAVAVFMIATITGGWHIERRPPPPRRR